MPKITLCAPIALLLLTAFSPVLADPDYAAMRAEVLALGRLTSSPAVYPAEGFADDGNLKAIYYDALPMEGKPTRVFAWLGLPPETDGNIPGIVLVHGGGGTAFKEWVKLWNARGFAAISIAVEGQTDQRVPEHRAWQRHNWPGPARTGIYGDTTQPLAEQWMFHAVADTVLANSLLRSLPRVDSNKVGLMGISWGGVITSTVIGIDNRFAFAIPTYGCGDLADAGNQYGRALGNNAIYREVWDPMLRMPNATMPVLWLSWTGDQHFPLDALRNCAVAASGPRMIALVPNMRHGHGAGWNPPDSYAFAQSIVETGAPWARQTASTIRGDVATITFAATRPIDKVVLVSTADTGFTGNRKWTEMPVDFTQMDNTITISAPIPKGTTGWFVNLHSGKLVASSDFAESDSDDQSTR